MASKSDLDLDAYFPYLINRVGAALVTTFGNEPLRRYRLNIAMWRALAALSKNGGLRLVDLGSVTSIDVSTLSRMVTRLVKFGLASRSRSETSDREVIVRLTPKGRRLLDRLIPVALRFEEVLTEGIPASDLAVVNRALHRMHTNMMRLPSDLSEKADRRAAASSRPAVARKVRA